MSKSKTCFEILVKKSFKWHLETQENQIGSIFKLNIKKKCQIPKRFLHHATCTTPLALFILHHPPLAIKISFLCIQMLEFCFFFKSMYVHGFEEKTKFQHLDTEKGNFYCQGGVVQNEKCQGGGAGGMVQKSFWNLTLFFYI